MKKSLLLTAVGLLLTASLALAQSATGTTTVSVNIGAEAAISITTGTTSLTNTGTVFNNFTGTTNFTYKIRTTKSGGTGTITLLFGGPLTDAASDTIALSNLSYVCTIAAPASGSASTTLCSGGVTASSSSATNAGSFGADTHSADTGTSGNSLSWTLTDNPSYKTGNNYQATGTFTISAT
jgi:hypothetical protein